MSFNTVSSLSFFSAQTDKKREQRKHGLNKDELNVKIEISYIHMICLAEVWTVVPREQCVFLQAGRYATKQ